MVMRKLQALLCFALAFCLASVSLADPAVLKAKKNQVKISIMGQGDFHPDRAVPGNIKTLPDDLAARIIENLTATKRFEVLERSALRRVVREQQFGGQQQETDLDRVIEETVDNLPDVNGWTVATAASVANQNDLLKEFKELGTTIGADYIVYAVLEKHQGWQSSQAVPYTDRVQTTNQVEARLRLRVIETSQGRIVGTDSLHTRISEMVFDGKASSFDGYSMFDHLGSEAAISILDMVFPPRVVSKSPWVINRGSDQHVAQGDRYTLVREGKEIKDAAGVVIGRIREEVGVAEVSQVQPTLSVVKVISGEPKLDDLAFPVKMDNAKPDLKAAPALSSQKTVKQDKPRLAVGLIKAGSTASPGIDPDEYYRQFTDSLLSRLTQTKRFQLIDRQQVDQLLNEQMAQAMAENREMPSAMGQLEGADYMVIGSVARFAIDEKTIKLPGSDRTIVVSVGRVEGNMRIVNARTGDIMESRKVTVVESVKQAVAQDQLFVQLADAYADQVTVNLMSAIYPIKVAAVVSGVAYINRGADGGLSNGEVLSVVRPGQPVIDPDTGVQLGVAETEIGQLTLTEVEDARSKAAVGGLTIQVGDILKRSRSSKGLRSNQQVKNVSLRSGGSADQMGSGPLTLAVGKIKINQHATTVLHEQQHTARMTSDLMIKLSQFSEFDVMERDQIDQLLDEKAFTAISGGSSMEGALQQLEGADYLVYSVIDDFRVRVERKEIPYTDEVQTRYYGTVEATCRLIDAHTGRLKSAVKVRLNDRIKKVSSESMAVSDLIDLLSTEMATRISDDLLARQKGELVPDGRITAPEKRKAEPKINHPNF